MNSKPKRATLGSTGVFSKIAASTPMPPSSSASSTTPTSPAGPSTDPTAGRPDRAGRTAMPFWVAVAARKQLRMMAAEMDCTQQDLMVQALNDLFEKHGKPRIA